MSKASTLKRFVRMHPDSRALRRLRELQQEYLGDLDEDQWKAIEKHLEGPYTSMEYGYEGSQYGTSELAQDLDAITAGAPRLDEPITTYRGSSGEGLIPDNEYPLTTTIDPERAGTYAEGHAYDPEKPGMLTEIAVPEGSPALTMPSEELFQKVTGQYPPFGDELELLLPPSDLKLIERFTPERLYDGRNVSVEEELKMLIERREYKPPYKARGGLVHGNA